MELRFLEVEVLGIKNFFFVRKVQVYYESNFQWPKELQISFKFKQVFWNTLYFMKI